MTSEMQMENYAIKLLTRDDVAEILRVSLRTVDQLIHDEKLAVVRFGKRSVRVKYMDLENYVNRGALKN